MNADVTEERRLILRLLAQWDGLRGDRPFPGIRDLEPEALGDGWDSCFVLTLAQPRAESTFQHLGRALRSPGMAGAQAGLRVADVPPATLLAQVLDCLPALLDKRVPVSLGGERRLHDGPVLCRSVVLPLSDDGTAIDHVLGAGNCRYLAVGDAPLGHGAADQSAGRAGGAGA